MRFRQCMLLIFLLTQMGCGSEPPAAETDAQLSAETETAPKIAWFQGDVDEAFALAKEENKPLFLYWGAVWCPPCHYLKNKIFSRPEFVAQSRALIPVYLDGDTERAQILAERFETSGYPTVILFNPAGQEITRMPSTLPVDRYREVLELAMARLRPVKDILADVQATGPANADPIDLNLLAFYSWGQDRGVQIPAPDRVTTFRRLYEETSESLGAERSRFLSLYLSELLRQARTDPAEGAGLADTERLALREAVLGLLDDPVLRSLNLELVLYRSRETVELLHPAASPERAALITAWKHAARALEDDPDLTVDDRLSALLPSIWLGELELEGTSTSSEGDVALPEEVRQHVRERIAWAGEVVTDDGELQAVMSTMAALLEEASLSGEAEVLLNERLADTVAPYYYMSWIASMKQESGQPEEALTWYRKAYDSTTGRYTRFRWGSTYLRQIMKLAPEDVATLEADSFEILSELLTFQDAFAGGNHSRLEQLASAYQQWNEEGRHDALIQKLRAHVQAACERYPEGGEDAQRSRCQAFLEPATTTAS